MHRSRYLVDPRAGGRTGKWEQRWSKYNNVKIILTRRRVYGLHARVLPVRSYPARLHRGNQQRGLRRLMRSD